MGQAELRRVAWFSDQLDQLQSYARRLQDTGTGGDLSILVTDKEAHSKFDEQFGSNGPVIPFEQYSSQYKYRRDGTKTYHAKDIPADLVVRMGLRPLQGKLLLCTASGTLLRSLESNPEQHVCVISVNQDGRSFQIRYGNDQYGLLPSSGLPAHLAGHVFNMRSTSDDPRSVVTHVHTQSLIDLIRIPQCASFEALNRTLYQQRIELLLNIPDLVAYLPFLVPGTVEFNTSTLEAMERFRAVALAFHGVFVRDKSIERCAQLIDQIETSARAALEDFRCNGALSKISYDDLSYAIRTYGINDSILKLFKNTPEQAKRCVKPILKLRVGSQEDIELTTKEGLMKDRHPYEIIEDEDIIDWDVAVDAPFESLRTGAFRVIVESDGRAEAPVFEDPYEYH